jgi:hypothetical protein
VYIRVHLWLNLRFKKMFLHKTAWLALGIFLITFLTGGIAESQAPLKDPKAAQLSKKKWKVIDGFRSAKFGMDGKRVLQAIAKDFKISKSRVKRQVHPTTKTTSLEIILPKLLHIGGPAKIGYILGFKSQKLIQVNAVWGRGVAEKVDAQGVVNVANFLRVHLLKKQYKREGFIANGRMDDISTIVFRGLDKKGRMALLILTTPKANKDEGVEKAKQKYTLKLSYILKSSAPDVFRPKAK